MLWPFFLFCRFCRIQEKVLDIVKWWWYLIKAVAWDGVENINKTSDFEIYSLYNLPVMIRNQFIIADEMTWKKMKKIVDKELQMWYHIEVVAERREHREPWKINNMTTLKFQTRISRTSDRKIQQTNNSKDG